MTDTQALRDALLDALVQVPRVLLVTPEGRAEVLAEYEEAARQAHPAVAEVLREAVARVRGDAV